MYTIWIAQLETTVSEFTKLIDKYGAVGTAAILIAITAFFVVRAATNAYTKQVNANTGQIAILTDSQRQINNAFDAQLKERMTQASRIEELHAKSEDLQKQVQRWITDYAVQATELKTALDDIDELKADRITKEAEIKTLQARLTSTEDKLTVATKSLSDFKEAMLTAEQLSAASLEQANQRYTLEKERSDQLSKLSDQQSQVIKDLRGKVDTQETKIIDLTQTVNVQQQTIDSQTGEIHTLSKRVQSLEAENDMLKLGDKEQPIKDESEKGTP